MELLYIWIEDYKNIKKQGFNFSPKHWFNFEYKEDENKKVTGGTLKHEDRNPNYPKDFFGEKISNVTAIVGKNGSGKSTLMEAILKFTLGNGIDVNNTPINGIYDSPGSFRTIIIYCNNDGNPNYSGFTNLEININHIDSQNEILDFYLKTKESFILNDDITDPYNQTKKINFIPSYLNILPCYYSNIFDEIKVEECRNREDIAFKEDEKFSKSTIPNIFRTDISINSRIKSHQSILDFHHSEVTKQAIFINQFIQLKEEIPFSLPPYLIVQLNFSDKNLKDLLDHSEIRMNWLKSHINTTFPDYLPIEFSNQIVLYLWLKGVTEMHIEDYEYKEEFKKFITNIDLNQTINWSNLFLDFIPLLIKFKSSITTHSPYNFGIIEYFEGIKELIKLGIFKKYNQRRNHIESFNLQDNADVERMHHFINNVDRINYANIFQFGFSYNKNSVYNTLSSGEKTLLKFGSTMWHLISKIKENHTDIISNVLTKNRIKIPSNLLLMLDEAELTLHPEWQKTFLDWSLKIIQIVCKEFNSIQVLYSSHSPFFLSDLPKGNVIFLKSKEGKDDDGNKINQCHVCAKEEQPEQTFGANIHSLYRNSFFLENGLMGEFAKGKIDGVIKDLNQNNPKNKIDEIKQREMKFIIEQIGEPLIKRKLKQMYNDKFHSHEQIDNRIKALEKEIKKLKERKS